MSKFVSQCSNKCEATLREDLDYLWQRNDNFEQLLYKTKRFYNFELVTTCLVNHIRLKLDDDHKTKCPADHAVTYVQSNVQVSNEFMRRYIDGDHDVMKYDYWVVKPFAQDFHQESYFQPSLQLLPYLLALTRHRFDEVVHMRVYDRTNHDMTFRKSVLVASSNDSVMPTYDDIKKLDKITKRRLFLYIFDVGRSQLKLFKKRVKMIFGYVKKVTIDSMSRTVDNDARSSAILVDT